MALSNWDTLALGVTIIDRHLKSGELSAEAVAARKAATARLHEVFAADGASLGAFEDPRYRELDAVATQLRRVRTVHVVPSDGAFCADGWSVRLYKNWLYVTAIDTEPRASLQIMEGSLSFGAVGLSAIRGPQEGVYALATTSTDETVGDHRVSIIRAMVGAGVYAYDEASDSAGVLPSSVDFLAGSGLAEWLGEISWGEATRFNQGYTLSVDHLGINTPISSSLETSDPTLMDIIRGLDEDEHPNWA